MIDLQVDLPHRPGALAELGAALGAAGVSLEGGGVFLAGGRGVAHFLVATGDGPAAREALGGAGLDLVDVQEPLLLRLDQEVPGQLGAVCAALAASGVQIRTQYSDHAGRLVLLVDDPGRARAATSAWADPGQDPR